MPFSKQRAVQKTKEWVAKNRLQHNKNLREYSLRLKREVVEHYGGKCECCNENRLIFLALDHIENDGSEWRRKVELTGGHPTYLWAKKNNFPRIFQILCHNCNWAKTRGGCPHNTVII